MKTRYIAATAAVLAVTGVQAQDMKKEVVIDREITPVERPAVRLSRVSPSILTPRVEMTPLSLREYSGQAEVTRTITPLEAPAWGDSIQRSPYRGYAALGYFPVYNLGAAAGYRLVHNNKADIGIHVGFDGASWKADEIYNGKFSRNVITVGADGSYKIKQGIFSAALGYTISASGAPVFQYQGWHDQPLPLSPYQRGNQTANIFDVNLGWKGARIGGFSYNVGLDFGVTGFAKDKEVELTQMYLTLDAEKETKFRAAADLGYSFGASAVELGVSADLRHVSDLRMPWVYDDAERGSVLSLYSIGGTTMSTIGVSPAYIYNTNNIKAKFGVNLDFNGGGALSKLHAAPNIELQWAPASQFAAYVKARGGEDMNYAASLWRENPWTSGVYAFERARVNADIEVGLVVGSYKGFTATLHGGWAKASNWLMPIIIEGQNTWAPCNIAGVNFGLDLGYKWKNVVEVVATAEGTRHGYYYRWRDNAKWAFNVEAKVHPIEKLNISLGYSARLDRYAFCMHNALTNVESKLYTVEIQTIDLGSTGNLNLGVSYDITPAITAFVRGENLLGKHWYIVPEVRSQGIHGLFGAQIKF